ncbi:HNH endonuclease signature motif containing protein, partial [Arthrobacter sp. ES3-54]|uniref:HNH endonuclease signature motif containing protein n=1 Tax=Arthrobacter sp. ES3-54 TaxID=1502991 RepID=UPI002404B446
ADTASGVGWAAGTVSGEGSAAGASAACGDWAADTASGVGWAAGTVSGEGSAAGASAACGDWAADTAFGVGWTADTAARESSVSAAADAEGSVSAAARVVACESGAAGGGPARAGASATFPALEDQPGPGDEAAALAEDPALRALDLRSRPQKLLDGLVGACKLALATGQLPASGGLRPQVMVTIDYRDLLTRLGTTPTGTADTVEAPEPAPRALQHTGTLEQTGLLLFAGPVTASTVRKIACDADIIPVLLGGQGRVLDIGRASRVFPPHIRKALTARDRGCAFPGCTIPAPWCEAHHIDYWSRGGTTGTENGTLLCSHHHHVIHKERWTIQLKSGIPWFIPPPHLDPRQRPRRNHYFRPDDLMTAA